MKKSIFIILNSNSIFNSKKNESSMIHYIVTKKLQELRNPPLNFMDRLLKNLPKQQHQFLIVL